jgi:hypothetical protein
MLKKQNYLHKYTNTKEDIFVAKRKYEMELENVATKSISNQIIFAYLSILQDSCDFVNGEIGESFDMTNSEILEITEFVKNSTKTLDELLSLEDSDKEDIASKIVEYRKILVSKYETFCAYLNQYNLLLFSMEEASSKQYLEQNSVQDIDFNKFFRDCYRFIQDTEDEGEKNYRIAQVIKYIPLTMTKERYFDYVRKSVASEAQGLTELETTQLINVLKDNFLPEVSKDYNVLFSEVIEDIDKYTKLLKTNLNEQELENISQKVNAINDTLTSVSQYLYVLYKDLNYLMILLSIDLSMEFIADSNPVYLDLYKTAGMILDNKTSKEDKEIYSETLIGVLDNHINDIIEAQEKVVDELEKLMDRYDDRYDDTELEGILNTDSMFRMCLNKELHDDIYEDAGKDETPTASKKYIEEKLDEFIEFLRVNIQPMTVKERKIHMQSFFEKIPPIWDEEECLDYIDMSMNNASSVESKLLAVTRIGNIMDARGFFEQQEQEHEHEHHHHDHHHDHDCECGHHHHS